ncbi:MAG: hypothetical protein GY811_22275 [Myxococcales bacterium]|nr:hypothetical protein [Myxococcales bacterium]
MNRALYSGLLSLSLTACIAEPEVMEIGESTASITEGEDEAQFEVFSMLDETGSVVVSNGMELRGLSRISSPIIDGQSVQATDILIADNIVYATYNTAGESFRGALQLIDISDPEVPVLLQEARLYNSEANRVQVQGDYIYVAGGDNAVGASLYTFQLTAGALEHLSTVALLGYQTTMLQVDDDRGYATSGDPGGVTVLDLSNPAEPHAADFLELPDARYVAGLGSDEFIVLAGGTEAELARYNLPEAPGQWLGPSTTASVDGVTIGAPSWGNLFGNDLYISADIGGLATFSLDDGGIAPIGVLPTQGDANGLAPTPDRRIAILANGQEGLVAIDSQNVANANVLASYDMPSDSGSANAIAVRHDLIALADGRGGVKLLDYNVNNVGARLTTILMTFSNPGIPESIAATLARQAVNWTSPRSPSRVIVIRDDAHSGESSMDTQFVVELLRGQGYEVDYMEEPPGGIETSDIEDYEVVWFSNPGWPLDDRLTFNTLVAFSQSGGGVVLQGDDMTWTSQSNLSLSPLTYLENIDNGARFCGVGIDNNNGGKYRVTFTDTDHPVIDGLHGESFTYGDDVDRSVPLGQGEEVLAWATLDGDDGSCMDRSPVVITFGPERAAQLQGL